MSEESGFKKITIVGVGLIGGSLGMAIKAGSINVQIVGVDKLKIIEKAIALGAIDKGTDNLLDGIQNADLIIIATPIGTILEILAKIAPHLKEKCLVTDTGSTKTEIMKEANRILPSYVDFIGGHPMAGSERFGIDAANIQLFKNKPYILTSQNKSNQEALGKMCRVTSMIGAHVLKMKAEEHDRITAAVSHLPQLIAISLINLSGFLAEKENNENFFKATGSAFADMTRIASSSFDIWKDIYGTNNKSVIEMIDKFKKYLDKIEDKLKNNPDSLEKDFIKANNLKNYSNKINSLIKELVRSKDDKRDKGMKIKYQESNREKRVAFQGERGAFSEMAAVRFFGNSIDLLTCRSFEQVCKMVADHEADYGILPVENSQTGSINKVHDLLLNESLFAVGEVILKVEHCLIVKEGTDFKDVKKIYSHPQALAQCEGYFSKNLPSCQIIPVYDTAGSVKMIKESDDTKTAAIASHYAADLYHMKILKSGIQDNQSNHTRFFIISPDLSRDSKNNKTSIIFAVISIPGAIYKCLKELAVRDINLSRLESRPSKRELWEYVFYMDFEKGLYEKEAREALEGMKRNTTFLKIIGTYYSETSVLEKARNHLRDLKKNL